MARQKYTYIPKDEIASITTFNNVDFENEDILDGAYVKGRKKYGEGGSMMAKGGETSFGDEYWVIVKTPKGLVTKKDFYGMGYSKKEIIDWCEERGWVYNEKGEKLGGQVLEEYEFFLKKPTKYDIQLPKKEDGGMMARGGRTKSALMRDRAYRSNEPHELAYKRKNRPKNPRYQSRYENGGGVMAYGGFIEKEKMSSIDQENFNKAVMKGLSISSLNGIAFGNIYNDNLAQNLAKSFALIGYDTKVVYGSESYVVWVKESY